MADMQNFSITAGSAAQVTVLDWLVACLGQDGSEVIADYTGANALHFPSVLSTLTESQQQDLLSQIATQIVMIKAGLAS